MNQNPDSKLKWNEVFNEIKDTYNADYITEVPYQIKKIAVKDYFTARRVNLKKAKQQKSEFKMHFRSKKNPTQSCYIPKSAVKPDGIYYTIAGKMRYSDLSWINSEIGDCRLVKQHDAWYIMIPLPIDNNNTLDCTENKRQGDVVAIDQGIRCFITYFSENGYYGQIGKDSFQRLLNINLKIDKLLSVINTTKLRNKKRNLKRKVGKLRLRLKWLVEELHWKVCNYLVKNYSVIILPHFNVKDMISKSKRKLRKTVVRSMLSFSFYEFSQRLEQKCIEYGIRLIRSNESYTSKTNSFTGEIFNVGSREWFEYQGVKINRDINGARNILLRAMRDSSVNC